LINATGTKDEELLKEGKIDFNRFWQKMDRSLGNKRKKIAENGNEKGIGFITDLYGNFEENEFVKILPNEYFGYWRVTVEQPLKDEKGKVVKSKGKPKPDTALRDYENIPFLKKDANGNLTPQTIEEYFEAEVKPHLPEAWIDESKTKTGYEINFTKYFYEFKPLRSLSEIKADILELEERTFGRAHKVLEI
jgi:type I restriction enzyme M protein